MTQITRIAGGRQPTNRIAADTYNPLVGGTVAHPDEFPIGTPVVQSSVTAATVIPGQADDATTSSVVGLAAGIAVVGSSVIVQMNGPIHLFAAQWDEITGGSGGLTFGAAYFLDAAQEGRMTTVEPSGGDFVTPIGIALSAEDFLIQITGARSTDGDVAPATEPENIVMFFGFTSGTGSAGNDYAATVAVGAPVPFPRDGAAVGTQIARSSASSFVVTADGVYEVSWTVGFSEASQLQVAVNGVGVANTCMTSGAGTQINTNKVTLSLLDGDLISIINPPGNAAALTVQPADGSLTHAQAPSVVIRSIPA